MKKRTITDSWTTEARCRSQFCDPDAWYPTSTSNSAAAPAKAVCLRCPVIETCLLTALTTNEDDGVWGAHTPTERQRLRKQATGHLTDRDYMARLAAAAVDRAYDQPRRTNTRSYHSVYTKQAVPGDDGHTTWRGSLSTTFHGRPISAAQIAFRVGHGRAPEGIVRPTCGRAGCVTPRHLADGRMRREEVARVDPKALLRQHSVKGHGGHVLWHGPQRVLVAGRLGTPAQLAFFVATGRTAVGKVRSVCGTAKCLAQGHFVDGGATPQAKAA